MGCCASSSFLTEKKHRTADSWAFDEQTSNGPRTTRALTAAEKFENGMHNFGEIVEAQGSSLANADSNFDSLVDGLGMVGDKVLTWVVTALLFMYGSISLLAVGVLLLFFVLFFLDRFSISSLGAGIENILLVVWTCIVGIGLFLCLILKYRFGRIEEQIEILKTSNRDMTMNVERITKKGSTLRDLVKDIHSQAEHLSRHKNALKSQAAAFDRLESALRTESKANNFEITYLLKEVQDVFRDFARLQREVETADLLNLFYELEFRGDGDKGLNEAELQMLLSRCDESTAAKFSTFEETDKNKDGNIDTKEFQKEVERIVKDMVPDRMLALDSGNADDETGFKRWKNWP